MGKHGLLRIFQQVIFDFIKMNGDLSGAEDHQKQQQQQQDRAQHPPTSAEDEVVLQSGRSQNEDISFKSSFNNNTERPNNDLSLENRSNSNSSYAFRNAMGSMIMSSQQMGQSMSKQNTSQSMDAPDFISMDNGQPTNSTRSYQKMRGNSLSSISVTRHEENGMLDLPPEVNVIEEVNENESDIASGQQSNKQSCLSQKDKLLEFLPNILESADGPKTAQGQPTSNPSDESLYNLMQQSAKKTVSQHSPPPESEQRDSSQSLSVERISNANNLSQQQRPVTTGKLNSAQNSQLFPHRRSMSRQSYLSAMDRSAKDAGMSQHTIAVTMGVTEEYEDSVHSLDVANKGYYEWKQDNVPRQKLEPKADSSVNESLYDTGKESQETFQKQAAQREAKRKSGHYLRDSLENPPLMKATTRSRKQSTTDSDAEQALLLDAADLRVQFNKRMSERLICPNCNQNVKTVVKRKRTCTQITYTSLLCVGIIVLWPCAYKIWKDENRMDYIHSCANCHTVLGSYNPTLAYDQERSDRRNGIKRHSGSLGGQDQPRMFQGGGQQLSTADTSAQNLQLQNDTVRQSNQSSEMRRHYEQ